MADCLWCEEERSSIRRLEPGEPRQCPTYDQVFKGNGWDGIDAHWKAKHERSKLPYQEFWEGIPTCLRHRG
jgi:hypothetical protein